MIMKNKVIYPAEEILMVKLINILCSMLISTINKFIYKLISLNHIIKRVEKVWNKFNTLVNQSSISLTGCHFG